MQAKPPRNHLVAVSDLARMLAAHAPAIACEIFPAGTRDGHEWRVGSLAGEKGQSLAIHLHGAKAGVWRDFASGQGGDLLDLARLALFGGDWRTACAWARRYLGIDNASPAELERRRAAIPDRADREATEAAEAEKLRMAARRIFLHGQQTLTGTPVDLYLQGRGIYIAEMPRQPGAIRYHPELWHQKSGQKWPAMVAAITGPDGRFMAVHRTWLARSPGGSWMKAPIDCNKMVLAAYAGGHIPINRGSSGRSLKDTPPGSIVQITEGIEDAFSVALIAPEARVIAAVSLSNMGGVVLPENVSEVWLWRQHDDAPAAIKAADRAILAHMKAGRTVAIPKFQANAKDANDVLKQKKQG